MCPCAPPRIRRTCCTASTAKRQVLETTQKTPSYAYSRGLECDVWTLKRCGFLLGVVCKHFRGYKRQQIPRFARNDNLVINRVAWQITLAAR